MQVIDSKGRVTLPADIRAAAHLEPGDTIDVWLGGPGSVLIASPEIRCAVCGVAETATTTHVKIGEDPVWYVCRTHAREARKYLGGK